LLNNFYEITSVKKADLKKGSAFFVTAGQQFKSAHQLGLEKNL